MQSRKRFSVLLLLLLVAVALLAVSGVISASRNKPQQNTSNVIPNVYSILPNIEILKISLIRAGTPAMAVQLELRNNDKRAVMAVDLVAGEGAVTTNGLTDEENPIVVIPPYGTGVVEMNISQMTPGASLVVSAVTYDDGTDEGDPESITMMRKGRARDRARMQELRHRKGDTKTP